MGTFRALAACAALLLLQGCFGSSVQNGAVYGAVAGAATFSTIGYAISDPDLLGSPESPEGREADMSIDSTSAILAGLAIGAAVGGVVGAMAGHRMERPNDVYLDAQAPAEGDAGGEGAGDESLGLDDDDLGADDTIGPRAF